MRKSFIMSLLVLIVGTLGAQSSINSKTPINQIFQSYKVFSHDFTSPEKVNAFNANSPKSQLDSEAEAMVAMELPGFIRSEMFYNDFGQNISIKDFDVDETTSDYVLSFESQLSYYPEGLLQTMLTFSDYDTITSLPASVELTEYFYDANEWVISEILSIPSEELTDYTPIEKTDYEYDQDGNVTSELVYSYNAMDQTWELIEEATHQYTFTTEGWVETKVSLSQFPPDTNWIINDSTFNSYTPEGWLTLTEVYSWDMLENTWAPTAKNVNSYDEHGNMITQEANQWSGTDWAPFMLVDMTFDTNTLASDLIFPYPGSMDGMYHKPLSQSISIWTGMFYFPFGTLTFEYEMIMLDVVSVNEQLELSIYPNPISAGQLLNIRGLENVQEPIMFTMYSLNGALVAQQPIQGSSMVPMSNLPAGLYTFQITDRNIVLSSGKLIVK